MSAPPFARPPGDPEAVLAAAQRMGTASGAADGALRTFNSGTSSALAGWDAPLAADFAQLSGSVANRMTAAVTQIEGAAGLVKGYGEALQAAQETIDTLTERWQAQQSTLDALARAEHLDSRQESDRSGAVTAQSQIESDAAAALRELRSIGTRVAGHIDDGTDTLVPGADGMTPEDLYNRVMAAWASISPTYAEIKRGAKAAGGMFKLANIPVRALLAVRSYAEANRAGTLLHQTRSLALAQASALMRGANNRLPGQIGILARDIADARRVADAASDLSAARNAGLLRAVIPASRFTRGLAGIGVVGSVYDLVANPLGETGARRNVSIAMDGVGIAAGGTALAASMGLVTLGPVGVGIVAAGLVAAGAWAAGTYIYDHWDDITHGVDVATDWVGDRASQAWNATTDAVEGAVDTATDTVSDIAGGVSDAIGGLL
jgi:hypothetical protein